MGTDIYLDYIYFPELYTFSLLGCVIFHCIGTLSVFPNLKMQMVARAVPRTAPVSYTHLHSLGLGQVLPGERAKMIPTAQDFFRWHLFLVSQTL